MIEPPTPVDELLRLETLRNLKILDTDPEERFDRVTRLAKRIFGTPIALVSLVDNDRQWFKSCQGLDVTQTSREVSFCGHAILDDQPLVVNDAHFDARFSDNPLVTHEPNIRFYAGYPLRAPDGKKVGALCIIDSEPREMTADDLELLQELGQMVEEELATANLMHTDPVTGLSNGVGFGLIAKHILAMCKRTNTSASLMLFHLTNQQLIDGFIGNEEGDRASIELAQFLMASFRDSDIVARIAKDAFATLLVGSNLSEMETAQQRLAERLETRNLSTDLDYQLEIESCAGAYDPKRHDNIEALLRDVQDRMEAREYVAAEDARAESA